MLGTCPTFYRMLITQDLSESVKNGCVTGFEMELWQYTVPQSFLVQNDANALLYPDSAMHIAQCYEGFKQLISKTMV